MLNDTDRKATLRRAGTEIGPLQVYRVLRTLVSHKSMTRDDPFSCTQQSRKFLRRKAGPEDHTVKVRVRGKNVSTCFVAAPSISDFTSPHCDLFYRYCSAGIALPPLSFS